VCARGQVWTMENQRDQARTNWKKTTFCISRMYRASISPANPLGPMPRVAKTRRSHFRLGISRRLLQLGEVKPKIH